MASVSAPGTGSGIDVASLVSQLIEAESAPTLFRLGQREAEFQAQFSGIGQLQGALAGFLQTVASLRSADTFRTRSAVSADESVFTASAATNAVPGAYDIEVTRLAAAQKLSSVGFAGATSEIGSGLLVIGGGGTAFSVAIPAGATTLADVRNAINTAVGNPGIAATLITVDAAGGGTETRLSLSASGTGTANAMSITVVDDDGNDTDALGLSRLVYDPDGTGVTNLTQTQAAVDAEIRIDNQVVTSASNTIGSAIEGVTIDLVEAVPGSTTKLTVELDRAAVAAAVADFVAGYNALRGTINVLTAFDPVTRQAGVLLGDAGVRSVSSILQRGIGNEVSGISAQFSALSEIGIKTTKDGTLELDAAALNAAMDQDFEGIGDLFAAEDGVATRLDATLAGFVQTQGVLDQRTAAISARISDIARQREQLDRRMADREQSLFAQFNAMDALISELQATSSFLTQQLDALSQLATRSRSRN